MFVYSVEISLEKCDLFICTFEDIIILDSGDIFLSFFFWHFFNKTTNLAWKYSLLQLYVVVNLFLWSQFYSHAALQVWTMWAAAFIYRMIVNDFELLASHKDKICRRKTKPRDCLYWPLTWLSPLKTVHVQCDHMAEPSGVGHDVPPRNVSHAHAAYFWLSASPAGRRCVPGSAVFTSRVSRWTMSERRDSASTRFITFEATLTNLTRTGLVSVEAEWANTHCSWM